MMRCICRDCCHVLGQEVVCRALYLLDRVTPEDSEVCVYFSIICICCVTTVGRVGAVKYNLDNEGRM